MTLGFVDLTETDTTVFQTRLNDPELQYMRRWTSVGNVPGPNLPILFSDIRNKKPDVLNITLLAFNSLNARTYFHVADHLVNVKGEFSLQYVRTSEGSLTNARHRITDQNIHYAASLGRRFINSRKFLPAAIGDLVILDHRSEGCLGVAVYRVDGFASGIPGTKQFQTDQRHVAVGVNLSLVAATVQNFDGGVEYSNPAVRGRLKDLAARIVKEDLETITSKYLTPKTLVPYMEKFFMNDRERVCPVELAPLYAAVDADRRILDEEPEVEASSSVEETPDSVEGDDPIEQDGDESVDGKEEDEPTDTVGITINHVNAASLWTTVIRNIDKLRRDIGNSPNRPGGMKFRPHDNTAYPSPAPVDLSVRVTYVGDAPASRRKGKEKDLVKKYQVVVLAVSPLEDVLHRATVTAIKHPSLFEEVFSGAFSIAGAGEVLTEVGDTYTKEFRTKS